MNGFGLVALGKMGALGLVSCRGIKVVGRVRRGYRTIGLVTLSGRTRKDSGRELADLGSRHGSHFGR